MLIKKPTQAEKAMFEKYGLYLVFKDEYSYKYAPVHLKDGYTYSPSIEVCDCGNEFLEQLGE